MVEKKRKRLTRSPNKKQQGKLVLRQRVHSSLDLKLRVLKEFIFCWPTFMKLVLRKSKRTLFIIDSIESKMAAMPVEDGNATKDEAVFLPSDTIKERYEIEFTDITLSLQRKRKQKVILEGLSGKIHAGRLCALMGPSGSGKSR